MARPQKKGLDYFPLDTDFFDNDSRIKILKARYRSDGVLIYVYLLCEIYKHGYYMEINDDLEYIISSELGMSPEKVKQVLKFLTKRSLFDSKLFDSDNVLTSAGIQKRFQLAVKERARKNPIEVGRYWLLKEEETEPFIKCTLFQSNSRKTDSYSRNNCVDSTEQSLKKSKVNNNIYVFDNSELQSAFQLYLIVRERNYGAIPDEQVRALEDELLELSSNDKERLAILKKATAGGWKSLYPLKSRKKENPNKVPRKTESFNNIKTRDYNFDELERKLLSENN